MNLWDETIQELMKEEALPEYRLALWELKESWTPRRCSHGEYFPGSEREELLSQLFPKE